MAAPAKAASNMDARTYEVKWKTVTIGFTKDVDPSGLKPLERDKRIAELNDLLIDKEIYGMEGSIKMVLHEVVQGRIRQLMPWAADDSNPFSINPTSTDGLSMYANAGLLTLHPKGDGGTTNDINILKAFPKTSLPKSAGGKNWREISVEWEIFPDQTALVAGSPTVNYGYIGVAP